MHLPDIFREALRTAEARDDFLCCVRIEAAAYQLGLPYRVAETAQDFFREILYASPDPVESCRPDWWNGDYTDHNQQMRREALRLTLASAERAA